MHDFRTKDYVPVSKYELKDFLENIFSRETAEYIIDLDAFETCRTDDPESVNSEYIDHLQEFYDDRQDREELTSRINDVMELLDEGEVKMAKEQLNELKKVIEDLKIIF